jgi:cell division protein FtsZ
MDEITEITDFIQDEAGSTADVIWGHGYDATLGDKLSITIIATGFNSNPITGFEKAPERTVRTLEVEPKNEIKAPLNNPFEQAEFTNAVEVKAVVSEPFLKTEVEAAPTMNERIVNEVKTELEWDLKSEQVQVSEPREEIVRHLLEDKVEEIVSLENVVTKTILSPEDQQRRTQERLSKIQEFTAKLKKADGIAEFENEPAFVRRNINLDQSLRSTEESVSRFGVAMNENGEAVLRNNNFLHDNVD